MSRVRIALSFKKFYSFWRKALLSGVRKMGVCFAYRALYRRKAMYRFYPR